MNPSPAISSPRHEPQPEAAARLPGSPSTPAIDSRALFGARNVLLIRHAEQDYTLRITRNGKLILTK